ncbi:MAG: glycoside hydrolase [Clostridiales bacterium]|nr:glycoside hydrolase [Clostridiales bacterium]
MKCKQFTTVAAHGKGIPFAWELPVTLEADEAHHVENGVINLYPRIQYQKIDGFGAAMTETSAYLFSKMDPDTRAAALKKYFGPGSNQVTFLRMSVDSCDYSLEEYQAVADPLNDPDFETFTLGRDRKYTLPMLKEALALADQPVQVLLAPWSPPAAWKTPPARPKNDAATYGGFFSQQIDYDTPSRCNGGSLKPEHYGDWARYLVKFVQAYLDEGVPVTMLSLQNESVAATNWDSCVWEASALKTFLRDHLYPEMVKGGLSDKVGLYIWDHNKERMLEYAEVILDEETDPMVEGIAFHWYSGDHFEAVKMTSELYPGKVLYMDECCGLHMPGRTSMIPMFADGRTPEDVEYEDAVAYAHDIIGNFNAGTNRWTEWNLCVDKDGGPRHVPGGFTAGMIADDDGGFATNLTYDYIGHFSRYIQPGAVRIGMSRCDDKVDVLAAQNPDGSLAVALLNRETVGQKYVIRLNGRLIRVTLPERSMTTLVIE